MRKRHEAEEWYQHFRSHLAAMGDRELTPQEIAQAIHEALEIAEACKYATEKTRFIFSFSGASNRELAEIRQQLTPFENSIVVLQTTALDEKMI